MRSRPFFIVGALALVSASNAALTLTASGSVSSWKRAEFKVGGIPTASNPFDPDLIAVDAKITSPTGRIVTVPAFWFQNYIRSQGTTGTEILTPSGAPEWRLRFFPTEAGRYLVTLTVIRPNVAPLTLSTNFKATSAKPSLPAGIARTTPSGKGFQTSYGEALNLIGTNLPWANRGGTYDYDRWFTRMASNGQNYARILMAPWYGGIEADPSSLVNYRQDGAWRMDHAFDLAEKKGIQLQLGVDTVAMLNAEPGHYGLAAYWSQNPYNSINGGPCDTQDDFFTLANARSIYKKRLRYLIARYGASPSLFAWEFSDGVDFVYPNVQAAHAADWLHAVGDWMTANDPYHHLKTIGLGTPDSSFYSQPTLDFIERPYYRPSSPAVTISDELAATQAQYGKPALATSYNWDLSLDPFFRGFRQSIWGPALAGGSSSMSWNLDTVDNATMTSLIAKVPKTLGKTGWATGTWSPISFPKVAELDALGTTTSTTPFTVTIPLNPTWGAPMEGALALTDPAMATRGAAMLPAFIMGSYHQDVLRPFRVVGNFGANAKMTFHLNSVAGLALVVVKVDGQSVSENVLLDLDMQSVVNSEYNRDIDVPIPSGRHTVEVINGGAGWFYLDWARATNVMPSRYMGDPVRIGIHNAKESLIYVVSPTAAFPVNATVQTIASTSGAKLVLPNMAAGTYTASFTRPTDGSSISSTTVKLTTPGPLSIPLPSFSDDLFVRVLKK